MHDWCVQTPERENSKQPGELKEFVHFVPSQLKGNPCTLHSLYVHTYSPCFYRLADHLSSTHQMVGYSWQHLRKEILRIAKETELDTEELQLIAMIPKKVKVFTQSSIDIRYLDPEKDQTNEELLLPTPLWCKDIVVTDNVVLAKYFGGLHGLIVNLNEIFETDIFYDCNV